MNLTSRQKQLFEFVKQQHGSQVRKYTGEPYTNHLLNVAEIVSGYTDNKGLEIEIALCHDLFEDTECEPLFIATALVQAGYDDKEGIAIVNGIEDLTDFYTTDFYPDTNRSERKAKEAIRLGGISEISKTVKYADIIDNSESIMQHDTNFAKVYMTEIKNSLDEMGKQNKGNPQLYLRAYKYVYLYYAADQKGKSESSTPVA